MDQISDPRTKEFKMNNLISSSMVLIAVGAVFVALNSLTMIAIVVK